MKKRFLIALLMILVLSCHSSAYAVPAEMEDANAPEGTEVLTIFAAHRKQQHPLLSSENTNLDTLWILFSDGQFRQYVIMDGEFQIYSCGTYAFRKDGDYTYQNESDLEHIAINRTSKYMEGAGVQKYSSIHPYVLNGPEYTRLSDPGDSEKHVTAVIGGIEQQPFIDSDSMQEQLDTYWIFYADETFEQYTDLKGQIRLFSTGTYRFLEENGFFFEEKTGTRGQVLITRKQMLQPELTLQADSSEEIYEFPTTGYTLLLADRIPRE